VTLLREPVFVAPQRPAIAYVATRAHAAVTRFSACNPDSRINPFPEPKPNLTLSPNLNLHPNLIPTLTLTAAGRTWAPPRSWRRHSCWAPRSWSVACCCTTCRRGRRRASRQRRPTKHVAGASAAVSSIHRTVASQQRCSEANINAGVAEIICIRSGAGATHPICAETVAAAEQGC